MCFAADLAVLVVLVVVVVVVVVFVVFVVYWEFIHADDSILHACCPRPTIRFPTSGSAWPWLVYFAFSHTQPLCCRRRRRLPRSND